MRKLINGIIEFHRQRRPDYVEKFAKLALGQAPDTLFIACSDSRVVPNLFASTEPGDLFVIRNIGNIVSPCGPGGLSASDESEGAALEFAVKVLGVTDVIVCGHSECAAMNALVKGRESVREPHLRSWLRHAQPALDRQRQGPADPGLEIHNQVSRLNTLVQLDHLRSYPFVREAEEQGRITLRAWWFDIRHADVYAWVPAQRRFILIDETTDPSVIIGP